MLTDFKPDLPRSHALPLTRRWGRAVALSALLASGVCGAEDKKPSRQPPEFRQPLPLPSVREAARATGISLEGLMLPVAREGLQPGDAVTALVTLTEGKEIKQWVIEVAAVVSNEKEKAAPNRSAQFFTSSGYEFKFGSERAALEIKIFGPLRESDAERKTAAVPEIKQGRVVVSSDYLALGLERVPVVILRTRAMEAANPGRPKGIFQVGNRPFPPEVTAAGRKRVEAVGITEADERAVAGSFLALVEFFQITSSTPGLQEVLLSVLDVPWWSIVSRGGKAPEVAIDMGSVVSTAKELDASVWGVGAGMKVYAYPFQLNLNGKPALLCQLAVVPPQPPLLVSAGIIGLAAGRPDGRGPVLTLQVVSSRAAENRDNVVP
jgi:hypothetical protein